MAERRMFAKTIVDSDAFLDMPQSTQLLYFHLSMRADDDGFTNCPKKIMRDVGCKDDDLKILMVKKFIIPFESGVVVIKHWKIHNYIAPDRYHETKYKEERSMLVLDENKAYKLPEKDVYTDCIQIVDSLNTEVRLGKESLDKINKKNSHFVPPTPEEVKAYCSERKNNVDPLKFFDYFNTPDNQGRTWIDSKGNKVKNWKQKIITWEQHSNPNSTKQPEKPKQNNFNNHPKREYTEDQYADLERKLRSKGL